MSISVLLCLYMDIMSRYRKCYIQMLEFKIMKCTSCNYGEIEKRRILPFLVGWVVCPYCGASVEPKLGAQIFWSVVLPLISVVFFVVFLGKYSVIYYLLFSLALLLLFMLVLYSSPFRSVKKEEIAGQKIMFGPTRGPVIAPLLIYGFGVLFWVV